MKDEECNISLQRNQKYTFVSGQKHFQLQNFLLSYKTPWPKQNYFFTNKKSTHLPAVEHTERLLSQRSLESPWEWQLSNLHFWCLGTTNGITRCVFNVDVMCPHNKRILHPGSVAPHSSPFNRSHSASSGFGWQIHVGHTKHAIYE